MIASKLFGRLLLAGAGLLCAGRLLAVDFVVEDIVVEGIERIELGTVFTYLPIKVGDEYSDNRSAELIRALYKTGFFSDVSLKRRGNALVLEVTERPSISDIEIEGNEDIEDEDLLNALRDVGIARGRVLNRSVLERLENELRQQYFARGKYNVRLDTEVRELERNRVAIAIDIAEGKVATIKKVNIVGNSALEEEDLLDDFESGIPGPLAFFSSRDKYSKQKLAGDLETLRSTYLDSGYLTFNVDSTQVSITPDRKDIYITINIDEGDAYTVSDVEIAGIFIVPEEELRALFTVGPGDVFSRRQIVTTSDAISRRLNDEGYAFAEVNAVPDVDRENKEVKLTFFVDPGQRIYVRRINILGNLNTRDEVYRRELRQMEGGWYSATNIDLSRRRIQRLAFIEQVDIETRRLPGIDDQIDLDITLIERLAGSFSIGAGFGESQGLLLNMSVTQDNFLGSGKRVGVRFDNSDVNTVYSLSYDNPFYTIDGVSRGFTASYTATDASEADISDYDADEISGAIRFGIPLTEDDSLRFSAGYQRIEIKTGTETPADIFNFLNANGNDYDIFPFTAAFVHDTRNRTVFADEGSLQRLNLEVTVPGGDLEYTKLDYRSLFLAPLGNDWIFSASGELAWGDAYGDTTELPFFERFFAGGIRSVRGYESNSLGPRDAQFNRPLGGDFRARSSLELIFPPFVEDTRNARFSAFFDVGNVFEDFDAFEVDELRSAVGLQLNWITPVGALTFSLSQALNDKSGDETETFQFNIGTVF